MEDVVTHCYMVKNDGYLDILPVCQHFNGIDGNTEEVLCAKGHRHTADSYYCLDGKCPHYEPNKNYDANLIAADVLDLLHKGGRAISSEEIPAKLQSLEDSRRGRN